MENNPACPLCYSCSGTEVPQQTPPFFYQYPSNNILINPTFSFITNGPPAKKTKLTKQCKSRPQVSNIKERKNQSSVNKNKEGSNKINKNNSTYNNNVNNAGKNNNSSWASNYLQSIGQSQPTGSPKLKKPIVCIPDNGKNYEETKDPTEIIAIGNKKDLELKTENTRDINSRVKSLLSSILPTGLEEKKAGIKINFLNDETSKVAKRIDKSQSNLIAQSVIPSISKFRIPKLKNNSIKGINVLKSEKDYIINNETNKNSNELKYKSITLNTSSVLTQTSKTKSVTSIPCLKTKANHLSKESNPPMVNHHKKMCNVELQTKHNEKQHQNIPQKDLNKACKIYKHSESLTPPKKENTKHLNKAEQTLNKKQKTVTKRKLELEVKEKQIKKDANLHNSLKQKYKTNTLKNSKLLTKTNRVNRIGNLPVIVNSKAEKQNVTCQTEIHFRNMKEKLVFSPKSPLKCQEENGNQSKNAFRAKMQNSHNHNEDFKGKFRANEGYDKGESKSSRESGNLYKEDIKKTTKANLDDTFKNISKKTSVKSIINTTNNFDLKFQTNNNLKKYPGVEDLRKKLNRVKKRDNLIVSVPNTIHERASITEQDQPIQTDPKKSKTKTIQLVINLICKKPRDTHFEEKVKNNETCQLASLDLSFLDDINVDDIVESLNYEETANKLTNTNNQSLHKIGSSCEEKYSNNDNSTTGVKIGSTSLTNMSNTSEKPTETYPDQEGYNIITDDLNLLRSKNITTKVKCAMTVLSSQTSTNQKQDTLDKINEYHRSKIQETQKERKKEIKREIIVLDEEQSTDILFLTNDKVKKENDAKIKTEITEVSLELLSNTQNRLTTQHFSYLNQDTFDTKLKDSQITKEIIKRIKNEMITEIIVLDDDDEPFTNSLISSNKEKQEKDLKGEIIVLDEEQLTDTFTLKPNTEIEKGNDTKIKTKIIEVNDATDESHSDMKNKLMTDIIVLDEDEHIFDSLINSSIQETSRHHIQNQNEINKNCVNRTENEPRKENNTNTSNTCHDNDTTHTSTVVNVPESKNLSIVPKANTSNTEIDASKNSSIGALPLSSISSFGTPKSNDENLAIEEEDTKVISNLNTKPEKNQKTEDPNQDESQNGNITQNDKNSVKSGKIKSKTDTIFVPADKYKATDDNFLDQTQKTLSVAKDGSNKKSTTNSKITPMGLAKTPCEETLLQSLKTRMLSYLGVNYDLGLLIRRGKYSTIFQCKDSKNKTTYAVKILNKEQDRYTLGIQKEIMLKDLQKDIPKINQHFVYLINGFGVDGRWCFLMEYYPKTLKEIFHENKKCFHIDMVQELSRQLVSAVMVLRNKNIVHSAIKPGHVLINNTMKSLKLCGFDESRTVDQVVLLPNLGTPSYRAPELILGYSDGFSIDVWSTALVMYEMATGRKLFPGMFNNDILYKQMNLLGNIPFEIVQSSIFKDHHFHGTHFMRKCGYMGKDVTLISTFSRKSCVGPNIFYSYKNAFGKTSNYMENITAKVKLRKLVDLLIQMLVLDPQHRLPIEFVYADPFIFESYNDDCLLRRFKEFS